MDKDKGIKMKTITTEAYGYRFTTTYEDRPYPPPIVLQRMLDKHIYNFVGRIMNAGFRELLSNQTDDDDNDT